MPAYPTAEKALAPAIIVCEAAPRWSLAVRRWLPEQKLKETRSLHDATSACETAPFSALVLEVTPRSAPQVVSTLVRLRLDLPHVQVVACAEWSSTNWALLLQEAGAAVVLRSPRQLLAVAPWLERHLARAPKATQSWHERLWSRLPWPEVGADQASDEPTDGKDR